MTFAEMIKQLTDLRDKARDMARSDNWLPTKRCAEILDTIIGWVEGCDYSGVDLGVLRAALDLWGKDKQVYIAVEELAELQKELLKNINRGENNRDHILEELADVLVVIECLKMIYQFNDREISEVMRFKVDRLAGRIEKAKAAKTEAKRG